MALKNGFEIALLKTPFHSEPSEMYKAESTRCLESAVMYLSVLNPKGKVLLRLLNARVTNSGLRSSLKVWK